MSRVQPITVAAVMLAVSVASVAAPRPKPAATPISNTSYRDGHTRPRALAFNPDDGLLYAALSTSDEVAIVDPATAPPRVIARKRVCGFPDAIAALPGGGVIVGCRFEAELRRLGRGRGGDWRVSVLP